MEFVDNVQELTRKIDARAEQHVYAISFVDDPGLKRTILRHFIEDVFNGRVLARARNDIIGDIFHHYNADNLLQDFTTIILFASNVGLEDMRNRLRLFTKEIQPELNMKSVSDVANGQKEIIRKGVTIRHNHLQQLVALHHTFKLKAELAGQVL